MTLKDLTIGYALCGSFCTIKDSIEQLKKLSELGCNILPIMSYNAYNTDTKFGRASSIIGQIEKISNNSIIHSIVDAEPIGPKKLIDILVIAPCTGNTLAKLANAITDTPVTMATKSLLRINRPVLIAIATNDGLGASASNIGKLLIRKNIYFTPFRQDNFNQKPTSLVANFELIVPAIRAAMDDKQLQPILLN